MLLDTAGDSVFPAIKSMIRLKNGMCIVLRTRYRLEPHVDDVRTATVATIGEKSLYILQHCERGIDFAALQSLLGELMNGMCIIHRPGINVTSA